MGWGIGCAAMRAALASRDQVLLQTTLQKVQSSAAGLANPEGLFQLQIFEGVFLDARSSVVFGCFLAIGTFIFALVRAYAPKLTFLSIFGTIAVDIFCVSLNILNQPQKYTHFSHRATDLSFRLHNIQSLTASVLLWQVTWPLQSL